MVLSNNGSCGRKRQGDQGDPDACGRSVTKKRHLDYKRELYWTPSPRFWDTLSKVRLTRPALREFDSRTVKTEQNPLSSVESSEGRIFPLTRLALKQLQHLAGEGGLDLSHIRGFANYSAQMSQSSSQSCESSSTSGRRRSTKRSTNESTTDSTTTERTTPYNADYEQKLIDAGIYFPRYRIDRNDVRQPRNHGKILERLRQPRQSLSPSRFTEQDFENFQDIDNRALTKTSIKRTVMPIIEGQNHQHHSLSDVLFNGVEPFDKDIAIAKPYLYDGVPAQQVLEGVRSDLDRYIIPSTNTSCLVAPNFFTECKSVSGRADVAKRQAGHHAAIGARAMHSLQNYGRDPPTYDGNAYSFANTYQDGLLRMYSSHPTAPKIEGGNPEYHMTLLNAISITGDSEAFRRGVTAYRNARDLASENRGTMIHKANHAASQMPENKTRSTPGSHTSKSALPAIDSDPSLDELARTEVPIKRLRSNILSHDTK